MRPLANLMAIVSMTIVLCGVYGSFVAQAQGTLATMNELFEAGKSLESAQNQVATDKESDLASRNKLLFMFAREPKSEAGDRFFDQVEAVVDQYRIKAANFVADSKKPQGWFGNVMRAMGPLGALRGLSKNFPYLREATERYAQHARVEPLEDDDVECDLIKFQIAALNKLMFVLQTDIKYLATERASLMNLAIYRQLQETKFVASHNFYNIRELTPEQRQLLKQFFLDRVDQDEVTVGEASEHFDEPSSLVLGRLHDSCHSLLLYTETWRQLEPRRDDVCSRSKLANKRDDLPASPHSLSDYDLPADFCKPFLDSL